MHSSSRGSLARPELERSSLARSGREARTVGERSRPREEGGKVWRLRFLRELRPRKLPATKGNFKDMDAKSELKFLAATITTRCLHNLNIGGSPPSAVHRVDLLAKKMSYLFLS